jgi:hypothetical protein
MNSSHWELLLLKSQVAVLEGFVALDVLFNSPEDINPFKNNDLLFFERSGM